MKNFYSLFKKDCQMMIAGKFIFVAFGSLLIYTLFINFGYINFMDMQLYNVYLYDPQGTQQEVSELIRPVESLEELDVALLGSFLPVLCNSGLHEVSSFLLLPFNCLRRSYWF